MSWDSLMAFVRAESPELVTSGTGVPPEEIARVEADQQLRLPDTYKRFLRLMGEDSLGFHLFGPGQNQRFSDMVALLSEGPDPTRYFRIARASDEGMVTRLDHFLDLSHGNDLDAPIVMFGSDDEFRPEDLIDKEFTFLEQAYRRFFAHIADARVPERRLVAIPYEPSDEGASSVAEIVTVLEQMRFRSAMEPLPRVACLRSDRVWALVAAHLGGRGFAVSLWSATSGPIEGVTDQMQRRFPRAAVQNRGRLHAV